MAIHAVFAAVHVFYGPVDLRRAAHQPAHCSAGSPVCRRGNAPGVPAQHAVRRSGQVDVGAVDPDGPDADRAGPAPAVPPVCAEPANRAAAAGSALCAGTGSIESSASVTCRSVSRRESVVAAGLSASEDPGHSGTGQPACRPLGRQGVPAADKRCRFPNSRRIRRRNRPNRPSGLADRACRRSFAWRWARGLSR